MFFCRLTLLALILAYFCSYCSSLLLAPHIIRVDPLSDDIDELDNNHETEYYVPLQTTSKRPIDDAGETVTSSEDDLPDLLLKSLLNRRDDYQPTQYDKRYGSQPFYAMRG